MRKTISFTIPDAQQVLSPCYKTVALRGFWVLGMVMNALTIGGAPTDARVAVADDGTTLITAIQTVGGTAATVKTTALGGATALPAHVDADSVVAFNLTFTAGTTPSVTKCLVTVYIDEDD